MKSKNKFIIIITRFGHFTVDPNIDLDTKTYPYFNLIISYFVLLFVDLSRNRVVSLQIINCLQSEYEPSNSSKV
jgi:hypothetical protein